MEVQWKREGRRTVEGYQGEKNSPCCSPGLFALFSRPEMKLLLYQSVLSFLRPPAPFYPLRCRGRNVGGWFVRLLPPFSSHLPVRPPEHRGRPSRAPFTNFTRLPGYRGLRGISLYTGGAAHTRWLSRYQRFLQRLRTEFRCSDGRTPLPPRVLSYLTPAGITPVLWCSPPPPLCPRPRTPRKTEVSYARQIKFQEKRKGPPPTPFSSGNLNLPRHGGVTLPYPISYRDMPPPPPASPVLSTPRPWRL